MYEVNIVLSDDRSTNWAPTSGVSLVIAFVEGVCGYKLMKMRQGWYIFRRDVAFDN